MRYTAKALLAGLLLGAGLFFVPFGFPLFVFFFLLFVFLRLLFGRRRGFPGYGPCAGFQRGGDSYDEIIPIDGYRAGRAGAGGAAEKKIIIE